MKKTVYVDKLRISNFTLLLKLEGLRTVYCLDGVERRNFFLKNALQARGVEVIDAQFFAGRLKTSAGESVYLAARRVACRAAFSAAQRLVESEPMLSRLNSAYGRNTIRLFISKQLARHIEDWTSRALVAVAISEEAMPVVWLKKPRRFPEQTLLEFLPDVRLRFYSCYFESAWDLAKVLFTDSLRFFRQVIPGFLGADAFPSKVKPGIFMLQEETVRADRVLRNQLYWLDSGPEEYAFETYVLKLPNLLESEKGIEESLRRRGVTLLPFSLLGSLWRAMPRNQTTLELRRDRIRAYLAALSARTSPGGFFLAKVGMLLWQSELMAALSKAVNGRVFVTKEPYSTYTDAMQLCAERLGVRTVAIQYSNIGALSPGMLATVDHFLIFSESYEIIFAESVSAQVQFIPIGYLFDGVADRVRERATAHRSQLDARGAKFVVCYFDESVQHDRWGLVSEGDHLAELHFLARKVLEDPSFGVLIKSQFIKNSPSQLYPADKLLQEAQATGRFLELKEGNHRNDIYPTEAALASDLCIGHKFGATAALEAAVAGVRTVILDCYGTKTQWDAVYASVNIQFEKIEDVICAAEEYRDGNINQQDLGDWSPILDHFVVRNDGKSIELTRNVIAGLAADLTGG